MLQCYSEYFWKIAFKNFLKVIAVNYMFTRSAKVLSLLVVKRSQTMSRSSFRMPLPLSVILSNLKTNFHLPHEFSDNMSLL